MERLSDMAHGLLSSRLGEGLCGHHPLFDLEAIRAAFSAPDVPVSREDAEEIGEALLVIARKPLSHARVRVCGMSTGARDALIRLYFRLLERAGEARRTVH